MTRRCLPPYLLLVAVIGCHDTATPKPLTATDPITAHLEISPPRFRPGQTFEIAITLDIPPGFELHRLGAPPPAVPTDLRLTLPNGFEATTDWAAPPTVPSQSPDPHRVYVGRTRFTRTLQAAHHLPTGTYDLTCAIRFQACTPTYCLPPTSTTTHTTVTIAR